MKTSFVEKCLDVLVQDQNVSLEEILHFRAAHRNNPDSLFLFCFLLFMVESKINWNKFLAGLETLYFEACNDHEEYLLKAGFLEPILNKMTDGNWDRDLIYPYLGPLSKQFIDNWQEDHRNPPIIMPRRSAQVEEVVAALCRDQDITPKELNLLRIKNSNVDDGNFLFAIMRHFMMEPAKTNWQVLSDGLEKIQKRKIQERMMPAN